MNSQSKPLVYLILGAAASGRREILADLITESVSTGERALVLLSAGETPAASDGQLGTTSRWKWSEGTIEAPALDGESRVFFVADGRVNPIDQIEAFKSWLETSGGELARIICIVNCKWAEQHKELLVWYDACIYFSDVVLLTKRENVDNKWLSDFKARYADQFYPCLFEMVKAGRVKNPAFILVPEARRMSHFFDDPEYIVIDDEDEEDEETEDGEEVELKIEEDPYMERRPNGRRSKEIPDVARLLPGSSA